MKRQLIFADEAQLLATKCFCNGAVTSWYKVLSSFYVFVSWDRPRLRKGTTAETQTLCARLQKILELNNKDDRVYVTEKN
jgi:hypothetical protein